MKKFSAFTLAETLIVIGIIGVVAALTIPTLTNETNSKETVVRVRKAQSTLSDAYGRMVAQYGNFDDWASTAMTTNTVAKRMSSYMKLTKDCVTTATNGCFASSAPFAKLSGAATIDTNVYSVLSSDSVSFGYLLENTTCTNNVMAASANVFELLTTCGTIVVDIDGPAKGRNTAGKDIFGFYITKQGVHPLGSMADSKFTFNSTNCNQNGGFGCTAWVTTNGNLDYLKTNSLKCLTNSTKELNFTTNVSCD